MVAPLGNRGVKPLLHLTKHAPRGQLLDFQHGDMSKIKELTPTGALSVVNPFSLFSLLAGFARVHS